MRYAILERDGVTDRMWPPLFYEIADAQRLCDALGANLTCRNGDFAPNRTFHVVEIGRWIEGTAT